MSRGIGFWKIMVAGLAVGGICLWQCTRTGKRPESKEAKLLKEIMSEFQPAKKEIASRYDLRPAPVSLDAKTVDATLAQIKDSLFFLDGRQKDKVRVKADRFVIPNGALADLRGDWTGAFTEAGANILRKPTEEEKEKEKNSFRMDPADSEILLSGTEPPVLARGTMHLTVPIKFDAVMFKAGDVGKARFFSASAATLKRCENNVAEILLKGIPDPGKLVVVPHDKTGRRLMIDSFLKSSQGPDPFLLLKTRGRIDTIEIFMPVATASRSLPVIATAEPVLSKHPRILKPRYADSSLPVFVELDKERLLAQVKTEARRNHATYGYNTPEVVVMLPKIDNSAVATIDFGKPELVDSRKKPVDHLLEKSPYIPDEFSQEIRFRPPEGKTDLVTFSKAIGKVRIHYPAKLKAVTLTVNRPAMDGVEAVFQGTRAMVRPRAGNSADQLPSSNEIAGLRAYDALGRQLRKLSSDSFWGEPREVQYFIVEKWIDLEIPYDLPPAPKLSEDQRGVWSAN